MSSFLTTGLRQSRKNQQPTLNQLPEPGKTNSTYTVPQVAWPAAQNNANSMSDAASELRDSDVSRTNSHTQKD